MLSIDEMTANILARYDVLNESDRRKGVAWYPIANDQAAEIGQIIGRDTRAGAGIIAALSPLKSWSENIRLATDAASGNVHGHFGDACRKAQAIIDGADPCDVLPMDAKTGNFFANICDPTDPNPVTIDRHAYRAATGETLKGAVKGKAYRDIAQAFRNAGAARGITGAEMQASVWGPMAQGGYGI